MKLASFGLSLALLFVTGCANKPDVISGTEELNPLISSSYAAADRLLTPTAKQELLRKDKRVLVASWVACTLKSPLQPRKLCLKLHGSQPTPF
jgi:hypothetical protein